MDKSYEMSIKMELDELKNQERVVKEKYENDYNVYMEKITAIDDEIEKLDAIENERINKYKKNRLKSLFVNVVIVAALFATCVRILYNFDVPFSVSLAPSIIITLGFDIPLYCLFLSNQYDSNIICVEGYEDKVNSLLFDRENYERKVSRSKKLYYGVHTRVIEKEMELFKTCNLNMNREDGFAVNKSFTRKLERK